MITSYLSAIISRCALTFFTVLFAGNINKAHLSGVGLAQSINSIVVMSLSQGYSYVFETYGPQVFGSSESREVTNVLLKCLLQSATLNLIVLGPYLNVVHVIRILPNSGLYPSVDAGENNIGDAGEENLNIGELEDDFRDVAVVYLRMTVIVEIMDSFIGMMSTYFVVLGKKRYVYIVSATQVAAHILSNYVFVSVLELKAEGLGLAAITGRIFTLILTIAIFIIEVKRGEFPWTGLSIKILTGWGPMIKLGIAGSMFLFTELSLMEISTFCSQFVSTTTLSTLVILLQISMMIWSIMLAVALSTANLMGTALAEGNVSGVKQYMFLAMVNILLEVVPFSLIAYSLKGYLIRIFTNDLEIVDMFANVYWLACVGYFFTHFQVVMNHGMLTAFGEQGYTAINTTIASYFIGLPVVLSIIFFTDLGLIGVLVGFTLTDAVLLLTGVVKILRTDVDEEIEKSRERVSITTCGSADRDDGESGSENSSCKTEGEDGWRGTGSEQHELFRDSDTKELLNTESTSDAGSTESDVGIQEEARKVIIFFFSAAILFIALAIISFL